MSLIKQEVYQAGRQGGLQLLEAEIIVSAVLPHLPAYHAVVQATDDQTCSLLAKVFNRTLDLSPVKAGACFTLIVENVWSTGKRVLELIKQQRLPPNSYACFTMYACTRVTPVWVWPLWRIGMVQLDCQQKPTTGGHTK